jgi:hypothetical protein
MKRYLASAHFANDIKIKFNLCDNMIVVTEYIIPYNYNAIPLIWSIVLCSHPDASFSLNNAAHLVGCM